MDSRERVIRTLNRERPDRVPMSDSFWEDTLTRWYGEGLSREAVSNDVIAEAVGGIPEYFGFDIDYVSLDASPRLEQKLLSDDGEYVIYQDRFGYTVRKAKGLSRTMDFMDHVTKDKAAWASVKERFVLDPDDSAPQTASARIDQASYFMHMSPYPTWAQAKRIFDGVQQRGRYVLANAYGPWEATWRHRGFTELLIDLVTDPEFVVDMAETYVNLLIAVVERCLEEDIRPDGLFMVEDLAYKNGMLMSPRSWRRIFKPLVHRLGQFLRGNGIDFWMHCCGNAEAIFEDLIDCGLQVMQPLEAKSGLDVRRLRDKYGDRLAFWGNIDVINMSNGSDRQIEEEIQTKITPFIQDGGGYLYHSDHSVPPEVSFERYQLVLELVRKYGTY